MTTHTTELVRPLQHCLFKSVYINNQSKSFIDEGAIKKCMIPLSIVAVCAAEGARECDSIYQQFTVASHLFRWFRLFSNLSPIGNVVACRFFLFSRAWRFSHRVWTPRTTLVFKVISEGSAEGNIVINRSSERTWKRFYSQWEFTTSFVATWSFDFICF